VKTFYMMLVKFFIPIFFVTLLFFVLVFELMDAFSNLWRYISNDVGFSDIAMISLLYLPKCISYSMPIALLFSCTYVLGHLYMNNELISIFGSGISLYVFVMPLLIIGLLLSVGGFFFDEYVVIDTFKKKNQLFQYIIKHTVSYSNSNVTVISDDNAFIYQVNYYNDKQKTLSGITIVERDGSNRLIMRIEAENADWNGENWILHRCRIFRWTDSRYVEEQVDRYSSERISAKPSIFRRISRDIEEMASFDARAYINQLKRAGLPYQEALSKYHRKFSFALTPLIVVLISSAIGGLFEKNVLLMSLLSSLAIVVVYYVVQMVAMALSRNGYLPPIFGAWTSFAFFIGIGIGLFRMART
jgi:lipopolysaccharide export system permease protein